MCVREEILNEVPVIGDIFGSGFCGNGFPVKLTRVDVSLLIHIC